MSGPKYFWGLAGRLFLSGHPGGGGVQPLYLWFGCSVFRFGKFKGDLFSTFFIELFLLAGGEGSQTTAMDTCVQGLFVYYKKKQAHTRRVTPPPLPSCCVSTFFGIFSNNAGSGNADC